jgi:hypothetical protein
MVDLLLFRDPRDSFLIIRSTAEEVEGKPRPARMEKQAGAVLRTANATPAGTNPAYQLMVTEHLRVGPAWFPISPACSRAKGSQPRMRRRDVSAARAGCLFSSRSLGPPHVHVCCALPHRSG